MSSSSASAAVAVDKATSDLLLGPDWTMNMEICDSVNSSHWQAKDVVKAVKRRLQHKSSRVQLLALTLLETLVKNCGDYLHFQIVEKNILGEMVKIVKKKADMQVRDKILVLLDSWQEAFGGPGGKYPQYYWTYEELRRSGVEFPRRSPDAAPIITPPASRPTLRPPYVGYGMPSGSSRTLDETMAADVEGLSLSSIDSMRDVMDLLNDMLQAVDPSDRAAVRDEVIVDLVDRCRSNQKKLMQMLTSIRDEELLARGLELNDSLQTLLAKHDAIASGSPFPVQALKPADSGPKSTVAKDSSLVPHSGSPAPATTSAGKSSIDEEDEEEDEFAQLARRHSRPTDTSSESQKPPAADAATSNALVLPDPPAPVKTTKEQDIIDLLSITLSTPSTPPPPSPQPPPPPASDQTAHIHQIPVSGTQSYPQAAQNYSGNQGQIAFNSYVVPWARPQQQQPHTQLHPQFQVNMQPRPHPEMQGYSPRINHAPPQAQPESQPYSQFQMQPPTRPMHSQYPYGYPPPPWADNSSDNQLMNSSATGNMFWTPRANTSESFTPTQTGRSLQHSNSFPARVVSNGTAMAGDSRVASGTSVPGVSVGQKPFVPSYRLFEDLNVFGKGDGRHNNKPTNNASPSLSGSQARQGMIGGRK